MASAQKREADKEESPQKRGKVEKGVEDDTARMMQRQIETKTAVAEEVDKKGLFVGRVDDAVVKGAIEYAQDNAAKAFKWERVPEANGGGMRPSRSTMNFGWDFVELEKGGRRWIEIPDELKAVQRELFRLFKDVSTDASSGALTKPEDLDNIIVTFYDKGESIVPHYDRAPDPAKPFHFGDSVFGLVLVPDEKGNIFWQRDDRFPGKSLTLADINPEICPKESAGMAFMMQSEIRNWPYYHGVIPVEKQRVSLTARVTVFKDQ